MLSQILGYIEVCKFYFDLSFKTGGVEECLIFSSRWTK